MSVNFAVVDNAMTTMDKIKQYIMVGMDTAIDVVSDFTDYKIQEFDDKTETDLKKIMTEYIEMELNMKQFIEAVQHVKETAREDEGTDIDLNSLLQEKISELQHRDEEIDLKDHVKYKGLEDKMKVARATGESSQDQSTIEGDIEFTEETLCTKCPFSGREMTDPVKNVHCGHSYDREGIKQLLKQRKGRAKCPVGGCANAKTIIAADLVENKEIKKFLLRNKKLKKTR